MEARTKAEQPAEGDQPRQYLLPDLEDYITPGLFKRARPRKYLPNAH